MALEGAASWLEQCCVCFFFVGGGDTLSLKSSALFPALGNKGGGGVCHQLPSLLVADIFLAQTHAEVAGKGTETENKNKRASLQINALSPASRWHSPPCWDIEAERVERAGQKKKN